jgi:hypothetical protein
MKIAPPSADLLIKLALGALLVGGAVWAIKRATTAASDAAGQVLDAASTAVDTIATGVNPTSTENWAYRGVNAVGGAVAGQPSGSWSLGTWIYDITHPGQ